MRIVACGWIYDSDVVKVFFARSSRFLALLIGVITRHILAVSALLIIRDCLKYGVEVSLFVDFSRACA